MGQIQLPLLHCSGTKNNYYVPTIYYYYFHSNESVEIKKYNVANIHAIMLSRRYFTIKRYDKLQYSDEINCSKSTSIFNFWVTSCIQLDLMYTYFEESKISFQYF